MPLGRLIVFYIVRVGGLLSKRDVTSISIFLSAKPWSESYRNILHSCLLSQRDSVRLGLQTRSHTEVESNKLHSLVRGSSYKVVVEAIVAEFEQLHEQTVLRFIIQVQVLPRSLKTNQQINRHWTSPVSSLVENRVETAETLLSSRKAFHLFFNVLCLGLVYHCRRNSMSCKTFLLFFFLYSTSSDSDFFSNQGWNIPQVNRVTQLRKCLKALFNPGL